MNESSDFIIIQTKPASVAHGNGYRRLIADFKFVYRGKTYVIHKGFMWDGASIPRVFWARFGHPFDDIHEIASLIHDAIYGGYFGYDFDRKTADEIYRIVLRMNGCGWWQAFVEHRAVRWCGSSHYAIDKGNN